jgi:Ca2+-transporting ATPase
MGRGGTDVAKEAADVVLLDDDLRTLIPAIEEGKGIFYNIRNFVRFQLSTSVAALALVAICTILQLPQPLNAMQILWINIIMDGPPAQSLGVEPVGKEVLRQPPRAASESIITWKLLRRILVAALTVVIGTLLVLRSEMATSPAAAASAFATAALGTGGAAAVDSLTSGTGAAVATALAETGSAAGSAIASAAAQALQAHARHATTMTFTTFVMFDMFNALSCRSMERSLFALNFLGNKVFLWAIGGSIAGQLAVIYFPPLQAVFQTAPLSAADWLRILVTASAVLWVDEGMKLLDSGVFARLLAGGGSGRRYRTPPQYFRAQTV